MGSALLAPLEIRLRALPPLAVYVHVPWCLAKCPYCDFNSHALKGELPEEEYVSALVADLEHMLPSIWGRPVVSVFLGGGTPSLLSPAAIERLLGALRARLPLLPGAEITLEANPGTFERERFRGFRDAGVTRLSLGIQSFDDAKLAALGRVHNGAEARAAAAAAVEIFPECNFDLMFALPDQTAMEAWADIKTAIAFGPSHLSCYHLTLEPNTAFARHPPPVPDADAAAEIEDGVRQELDLAGFRHYEVSAHAKPGHACRHNLNYWQFGDYLGLGAGAHGKISFPDRVERLERPRSPRDYLEAIARGDAATRRRVAPDELVFEFMLNALRLTEGVSFSLFAERTGLDPGVLTGPLQRARERGLVHENALRLAPTELGQRFLDDLVALFLPMGHRKEEVR